MKNFNEATLTQVFQLNNHIKTAVASLGNDGDYVVLVHGLLRNKNSMKPIQRVLDAHNYITINVDLPLRKHSMEELSYILHQVILRHCTTKSKPIHFVTHSLGGCVVTKLLANEHLLNAGKLVFITPPLHGSKLAKSLVKNSLAARLCGPVLAELAQEGGCVAKEIPMLAKFKCLTITAVSSLTRALNVMFKGPNDGVLEMTTTKYAIAKNLALPGNHYNILNKKATHLKILEFLKSE